MGEAPQLNRSLSLGLLTLYGLGTTIGAGIFVLVGKVAGASGALAPVSFLLGAVIAGLSAFSFGELSSRHPESGGEAVYVKEGLGSSGAALCVGLLVVAAGVISTSAIIVGFAGYVSDLVDMPRQVSQVVVVLVLAGIAFSGIKLSVSLAAGITLLEIGTLAVIIGFGVPVELADGIGALAAAAEDLSIALWPGIVYGAILAFYAFIGFEDIVNVAEETRDAERIVPIAILLTLVGTTLLYVLIAILAVQAVPVAELAASDAPLTLLFERISGMPGDVVTLVAIVSVLNGALVQVIMASRVLFGLSRRGWLPGPFGSVHPRTRTPANAIALCAAVVLVLTLGFDIEPLAVATSYTTLAIFALVNVALVAIKLSPRRRPHDGFTVPLAVPLLGVASICGLTLYWLAVVAR